VERERRFSAGAKHLDVRQAHFRPVAVPTASDRTDGHALSHGMKNRLRARAAVIIYVRQNQIAQNDDRGHETQAKKEDRVGGYPVGPERTVLEEGETILEKHGSGRASFGGAAPYAPS